MFQHFPFSGSGDPDVLVFWLTTVACSLFALVAQGGPAAL